MDKSAYNNYTRLCGYLAGAPEFSHSSRGQDFYTFPLEVERLSGNVDTLNVIIRKSQLTHLEAENSEMLLVEGQLRSFNNRRGQGAKLVITVFAKELYFCDGDFENQVFLSGTVCKEPNLRCTPMGRDICDLMLAVNRPYGRSDYLPCICWGSTARLAAHCSVGTKLSLEGRIQSRKYIKVTESGAVEKTAFEVSVSEFQELTDRDAEKLVSLV